MKKLLTLLLLAPVFANAQTDTLKKEPTQKHWYEKISIRGYAQLRYNRLLETNPKLRNESGDKSIGEGNSFFIRRMRLIVSAQVHERVYIYFQTDFGNGVGTGLNYGQLRDGYVDIGFDRKNEYRIRVGQSKVPYGFENMQSSSNRMPLDRGDAINSGVPNERDLGAFFYWAPDKIRKRFAMLVNDGLKGSGDYGVFAFGAYNGQCSNKPELNNELHVVSRVTYPFLLGKKQIFEPWIQAYTGNFVMPTDQLSKGVKTTLNRSYLDQRAGAGFNLYPQPIGVQAEYNVGKGPQFNQATDSIEVKNLQGGYVMLSYNLKLKHQQFYPYVRGQYYTGGRKNELDARSYDTKELEIGSEWLPNKYFELTVGYMLSNRNNSDVILQNNVQKGNMLRVQMQMNF